MSLKEIRIRPKTDQHDREIKVNRAKGFLEEGHKVQFTMLFRGRERFHRERAMGIFTSLLEEFGETIKIERPAMMEGRRMTMVVAPVKPKTGSAPKAPKAPKAAKTSKETKAAAQTTEINKTKESNEAKAVGEITKTDETKAAAE